MAKSVHVHVQGIWNLSYLKYLFEFPKIVHWPGGQVKNRIHKPIGKFH